MDMHFARRKRAERDLYGLHQRGDITHACFAIGLTMLWRLHHEHGEVQVSYDRLAILAGVARSTAQEALQRLRALGVLAWRQTRLRIAWRGGFASRQWRNVYRFLAPDTDTGRQATSHKPVRKQEAHEVGSWSSRGPQPPVRSVQEQIEFCLRPG